MNDRPEDMETLHDQEENPSKEKDMKRPSFSENDAQGPSAPKERAGVVLKRAREAQGLSLDVVHEATKIPLDALRAIEEGYTVRILSPFYYKGFLKMYAGYLGLDASEVIEDYKEEELPQHIDQPIEEFEPPQWIKNLLTKKRKQQIVIAVGLLIAVFLLFKIAGFFAGWVSRSSEKKNNGKTTIIKTQSPRKEAAKAAVVKKETKKTVEAVAKETRQEPPKIAVPKVVPKVEAKIQPPPDPEAVMAVVPAAVPNAVPAAVVAKNIALTVRAKQNSWLRVRTDGDIVFQSTLRLGAVETWMADKEIEISGKNIDQLEFELNGKMIGTLGRKDRNAKKVVITENGLSVKD